MKQVNRSSGIVIVVLTITEVMKHRRKCSTQWLETGDANRIRMQAANGARQGRVLHILKFYITLTGTRRLSVHGSHAQIGKLLSTALHRLERHVKHRLAITQQEYTISCPVRMSWSHEREFIHLSCKDTLHVQVEEKRAEQGKCDLDVLPLSASPRRLSPHLHCTETRATLNNRPLVHRPITAL